MNKSLIKKGKKVIERKKDIPKGYFIKNDKIEGILFRNLKFDSEKFRDTRFRTVIFENCSFSHCIFDAIDFQRVNFFDCTFTSSCFTNFRYITGENHRTKYLNCDKSSSFIQNVKYLKCVFDDVDYSHLKAKSITFADSKFNKINFDKSRITRGAFSNIPNLDRRLFYHCKLDECDFDWNECFVIMGFGVKRGLDMDNYYHEVIERVLKELKIEPLRVDKYEFKGKITDEILTKIKTCRFVIAELSSSSKNAFFEVGYAIGNDKDVIFCVDYEKNIPFDLKDYPFIVHQTLLRKFRQGLKKRIRFLLETGFHD